MKIIEVRKSIEKTNLIMGLCLVVLAITSWFSGEALKIGYRTVARVVTLQESPYEYWTAIYSQLIMASIFILLSKIQFPVVIKFLNKQKHLQEQSNKKRTVFKMLNIFIFIPLLFVLFMGVLFYVLLP